MGKRFTRNQLRKISRQINANPIAIDDLEVLFEQFSDTSDEAKIDLAWKKFGMFREYEGKNVITFFTTKGGVLKTTLAYNFARIAALSGVKTIVLGLDMQCDITNCISGDEESEHDSLKTALEKLSLRNGLTQFFNRQCSLEEIIYPTDLALLSYVPESPDLTLLNDSISLLNRREFWLKEKVINPILEEFDMVIIDCSPNWNRLTTNALCASDLLVSPVECKINNFKNIEVYQELIGQVKEDMFLSFNTCYVPTRFCANKKLSREIHQWYKNNLQGCCEGFIRESIESEEAIALQKSIVEYHPTSKVSSDMLQVVGEICKLLGKNNKEIYGPIYSNKTKGTNQHGFIS